MDSGLVLLVGIGCALTLIAAALWSLRFPQYRLWPPNRRSYSNQVAVWVLTAAIFWSAANLGLRDWNGLDWSVGFRWGIGLPLILAGNLAAWIGMWQLGFRATSGEATGLVTHGLYARSRNPQYLGNMTVLIGWFILSASLWSLLPAVLGLAVFLVGTVAEDRWLLDRYGKTYRQWRAVTPHFF